MDFTDFYHFSVGDEYQTWPITSKKKKKKNYKLGEWVQETWIEQRLILNEIPWYFHTHSSAQFFYGPFGLPGDKRINRRR